MGSIPTPATPLPIPTYADAVTEASEYARVAAVDDLPPGRLLKVQVDEQQIVLGNADGLLFALSGLCSHEGSDLALGSVQDRVLTCFAHRWTYNVETGVPVSPPIGRVAPGYRLRTYRVKIEGDSILVSRRPSRLGLG